MIINYVGFDKLSLPERSDVQLLSEKYADKLVRVFPQSDASLIVQVKLYDEAGARVKYAVHVRAGVTNRHAADGVDWVLLKALRSALVRLVKEVNKDFRRD